MILSLKEVGIAQIADIQVGVGHGAHVQSVAGLANGHLLAVPHLQLIGLHIGELQMRPPDGLHVVAAERVGRL